MSMWHKVQWATKLIWASWKWEQPLSSARHNHSTLVIKPTGWAILDFVGNDTANTIAGVLSPLITHINCSTHLRHSAATPMLCCDPGSYQHMHRYSCSHRKHMTLNNPRLGCKPFLLSVKATKIRCKFPYNHRIFTEFGMHIFISWGLLCSLTCFYVSDIKCKIR